MMPISLLGLMTLNYIYIGILPRIFFRGDGKYNLMWWTTAGPLFLNAIVIVLAYFGLMPGEAFLFEATTQTLIPAILSAVSIGLISYTLGTHRVPLALWHQRNDAPVNIVTWGAYKRIRHPFYTSFILSQIASTLAYPHLVTGLGLIWAIFILNSTAAREEKNLSASQYGEEYKEYIPKTGRFFPKLRA
jgi:protein-S-isoprenylcysteine O-methyltransferase Ste14